MNSIKEYKKGNVKEIALDTLTLMAISSFSRHTPFLYYKLPPVMGEYYPLCYGLLKLMKKALTRKGVFMKTSLKQFNLRHSLLPCYDYCHLVVGHVETLQ